MFTTMRKTVTVLLLTGATAATAAGINGINGGMPNRISMNVTVAKQTQGATFGEKVQSGLHAAGNVVASGVDLIIECGATTCAVALPDGSGYRAELQTMTIGALDPAQGLSLRKTSGATAVTGGAPPGGNIVSAAVSSVGNLKGGGAAAASYAANGRSAAPIALASQVREDGGVDVTEPLVDGDYALTIVVEKATSGLKDTLKTQVRTVAPARIKVRFIFSAADGALRARNDSSENSIAVAN